MLDRINLGAREIHFAILFYRMKLALPNHTENGPASALQNFSNLLDRQALWVGRRRLEPGIEQEGEAIF